MIHLQEVPKSQPQEPPRRRLKLRDGQLDIELLMTGGQQMLEVALFKFVKGLSKMLAYSTVEVSKCYLRLSLRHDYVRLWLHGTSFAITEDEAARIREAFPEIRVREDEG